MKRPNWNLGNDPLLLAVILLAFLVAVPSLAWSQLLPSDFQKRFATTTPPTRVRINETLPLVAILVEFSDQPRQFQRAQIQQMLFGPAPSVVDYFSWVSDGKFRFVQAGAGTLGWFTAPRTQAAYTAMQNGTSVRRTDSILVARQALAGLNLTDIDRNDDKIITANELTIVLIWASPGAPDNSASVRSPQPRKLNLGNGFSLDMPLLAIYEPRIGMFPGGVLSPATVAHEIAHVAFGLGDQYPTGRPTDTTTEALCGLSLMSSDQALNSSAGVPILDAWALLQLGWLNATVAPESTCFQLRAVEHHHAAIIVPIYGRGTTEYFIVENRFPQGTYNAGFAPGATGIDKGIAVWHIDETLKNNNIIDHRRAIRLLRATGPVPAITCAAANQGRALFDSSDPPTAYPLTNSSSPRNTRRRDGSPTGIEISSIPSPRIDSRIFIRNPYQAITTKVAVLLAELRPLEEQVRNLQRLNRQLDGQVRAGDISEGAARTLRDRNNARIAVLQGQIATTRSKLNAVERETVAEFSALPVANGCP